MDLNCPSVSFRRSQVLLHLSMHFLLLASLIYFAVVMKREALLLCLLQLELSAGLLQALDTGA